MGSSRAVRSSASMPVRRLIHARSPVGGELPAIAEDGSVCTSEKSFRRGEREFDGSHVKSVGWISRPLPCWIPVDGNTGSEQEAARPEQNYRAHPCPEATGRSR